MDREKRRTWKEDARRIKRLFGKLGKLDYSNWLYICITDLS